MNRTELERKILEHQKEFDLLFEKIKSDVMEYNEANPQATMYGLPNTDNFCNSVIESSGWIKDKINGTLNLSNSSKKSLVKKLRKVLGYTYP